MFVYVDEKKNNKLFHRNKMNVLKEHMQIPNMQPVELFSTF